MRLLEGASSILVVSPHGDDEVLGCGGIMAKAKAQGVAVHVVYMAVDGFHHYGVDGNTTLEARHGEIDAVAELLGFTHEIMFDGRDLIEKLDTLAKRDLVDRFERIYNDRRPDVLLLPYYTDYDQDHRQTFETGFAAARPIAARFGKWLIPHVLAYEQTKLGFAWADLPRPAAFLDISPHIETKLEAIARHATQLRPTPHVRSLEAVRALARIRGSEIGVDHAEAFQVLRMTL